MALLGEKVNALQALEWGLINRIAPDDGLVETAMGFARALANGPASLGLSRQILWASLDDDWAGQLHRERLAQRTAGKTRDFTEGVSAFLQKRPAKFTGQ